ncbi:NIPSNAP family protein [Zavarzinella formosa]|uniref:NIPSNAP family protein n=1 Tax=Zavarzinella formosa TaxID=360055 RepID=UPI0002F934D4|nr:NIPSNAP family protein [Zavarzinella formosa]
MKRLILCLSVCLMSLSNAGADTPPKAEAAAGRVYEMRTYYANPGKMTALHARFKDHTCRLFEKHGITLVGFWSPTDEKQAEDVMIYILSYPSKEAADKSWKAFREDPEWIKAKEASEKDGGLVKKAESLWLKGTPYSPLK